MRMRLSRDLAEEADKARAAGNYAEADRGYKKALAWARGSPDLHFRLVAMYVEQGRKEEALRVLGSFLNLSGPHRVSSHIIKALAVVVALAEDVDRPDLVEEALQHVDRYVVGIPYAEISQPPVSATERLALAHLVLADRLSSGKPERAHEHLLGAKRLDPDLAIAWFLDWEVLGNLGRRQEAEASLARAGRLAPAGSSLAHRIAKLVGPQGPVADP